MKAPVRILIVGAKGYVGAELAREMLDRGHKVVAVDIGQDPGRLTPLADKIEWTYGDGASIETIYRAIGRKPVDAIYYGPFYRGKSVERELELMASGTWRVFQLAQALDIRRIIFPSSTAVHGHQRPGVDLVSETEHLNTDTLYGSTKLMCEHVGAAINRVIGRNVITSVRLPSVYGPGAEIGSRRVNVPAVQAARGQIGRVDYPAEAQVCIAHIADTVRLIANLCEADVVQHSVYELGGLTTTFGEIASVIEKLVPGAETVFGDESYTPLPHSVDWSRIRKEFGMEHRSIEDGMASILEFERAKLTGREAA